MKYHRSGGNANKLNRSKTHWWWVIKTSKLILYAKTKKHKKKFTNHWFSLLKKVFKNVHVFSIAESIIVVFMLHTFKTNVRTHTSCNKIMFTSRFITSSSLDCTIQNKLRGFNVDHPWYTDLKSYFKIRSWNSVKKYHRPYDSECLLCQLRLSIIRRYPQIIYFLGSFWPS